MPERWWIPVLAAVVGLIAGVGGAYVGGEVANKGQQQQFENQRAAEVQDLLIAAYARYLRDATATAAATGDDRQQKHAKTKELAARALASETEVEFKAASPAVDDAARRLYDAVTRPQLLDTFEAERQRFIDAAGRSLEG